MMRHVLAAAVAALALAACNQGGGGPALPKLQEGAQAPATLTPGKAENRPLTSEATRDFTAQVSTLLDRASTTFAGNMMRTPGVEDVVVPMQPGADHRWVVSLESGRAYTFVAQCDQDCTNIDLELIDMTTGGVIASDLLPDDFPVVNFQPEANARYMVRMLMQTCNVAPCFAGTRQMSGEAK